MTGLEQRRSFNGSFGETFPAAGPGRVGEFPVKPETGRWGRHGSCQERLERRPALDAPLPRRQPAPAVLCPP